MLHWNSQHLALTFEICIAAHVCSDATDIHPKEPTAADTEDEIFWIFTFSLLLFWICWFFSIICLRCKTQYLTNEIEITSDDTSNGKQEWLTKYVVYLFGLFTDRFCCVPETRQSNGQYVRLTSWHEHHWMGADLFRLSRRVTLDTLRFWMHYDTREIETNMRLMHSSSCHTAWRKDKKKKNENVMLCDANREWDHAQKRRWIAMCNVVAVSVGWWKVIYVCVYMHRSSNPDTGYNMAYTTCMFVFGFGVSACYNYDTLSNRSTERIGLWTIGFTISLNARTMFTILFCIFFTFKLMKFCMYVQLSHTPHTGILWYIGQRWVHQ